MEADNVVPFLAQVGARLLLQTKESPWNPTPTQKVPHLWTLLFKVQHILFMQPWSYDAHGYQKPILRTSVPMRSKAGVPKENLYC